MKVLQVTQKLLQKFQLFFQSSVFVPFSVTTSGGSLLWQLSGVEITRVIVCLWNHVSNAMIESGRV